MKNNNNYNNNNIYEKHLENLIKAKKEKENKEIIKNKCKYELKKLSLISLNYN